MPDYRTGKQLLTDIHPLQGRLQPGKKPRRVVNRPHLPQDPVFFIYRSLHRSKKQALYPEHYRSGTIGDTSTDVIYGFPSIAIY